MHFRNLLSVILLLLALLMLLPVASMVASAFWQSGGFDTEAFAFLLHEMGASSFRQTLLLAALVAMAGTAVGMALALVLVKLQKRFALWWTALLLVPLLVPPYIYALGWYETVGRSGFWGELLFGFQGLLGVLFFVYLPIPMLLGMLALRRIDPRLEEAALLVTGWGGVLRHITMPLMLPAAGLSFLLLFILAFGEQSVANFLRVKHFAQESFTYFAAFYDFQKATVLAVAMVVVALLFLLMERHFIAESAILTGGMGEVLAIDRPRWRQAGLLFLLFLTGVGTVLPFVHLFAAASWSAWPQALMQGWGALARSYLYAGMAGTLMTLLALLGAFMLVRKLFGARFYDTVLLFLFALPATVIAIAFIGFWNRPATLLLYTTPLVVLLAYTAKYLILPTKIVAARFGEIPRSLIDAAALAGAHERAQLRYIYLPLAKRALVSGWLIAFIFSLRETTMTMLLYPPGYETLPLYILTQMANGDPAHIAVLATLMVLMTLVPLLMLLVIAGARR